MQLKFDWLTALKKQRRGISFKLVREDLNQVPEGMVYAHP